MTSKQWLGVSILAALIIGLLVVLCIVHGIIATVGSMTISVAFVWLLSVGVSLAVGED